MVENIGGAGGSLGMTRAAQAAPDGYTIAVGNMGTQSAAPALYPNLKYDPAKSFAQIGIVNYTPQAVVSKKALPTTNLKDFIAYVKGKGSAISYGHAGVGSISHVAGLVFNAKFGLRPISFPIAAPVRCCRTWSAGQIDYTVDQSLNVIPQIKAGTIKVYAVAAPARLASIAGCADHQGGRRGFHLQRLERHGGAQGHAEGHRREARRRARTRRSTIRRSRRAMSSSAARRRRAPTAGRPACRSSSRARWRASRR